MKTNWSIIRLFVALFLCVGTAFPGPIFFGLNYTDSGSDIIPDVAWWKMNEGSGSTAADSTGNGNTGTLIASPTWITGPGGNGALTFNGSTQYVSTLLTNVNYASGTVTWWQNPSTAYNSGAIRAIWGQMTSGVVSPEFSCQVFADNNWYVGWNAPGSDHRVVLAASSGNYIQGAWHFYAFTWAAGGSALFLDGSSIASVGTAPSVSGIGDNFELAAYGSAVTGRFPGSLDDFRIYSRVLSGSEITTLYINGAK